MSALGLVSRVSPVQTAVCNCTRDEGGPFEVGNQVLILDESFDVGEDTGTPAIDDYEAKMPFKFAGRLDKVEIKLGPDKLTPQQRGELEQLKRDFALAVQ
jgi:hypothetical protein